MIGLRSSRFSVIFFILLISLGAVQCGEKEEVLRFQTQENNTDTLKVVEKGDAEIEEEVLEKSTVDMEKKLEEVLTLLAEKERALATKESELDTKESRIRVLQTVSWIVLK